MEPIVNIPQPSTPSTELTTEIGSEVSVSVEKSPVISPNNEPNSQDNKWQDEDTNAQIIENLKEQRDELRGTGSTEARERPKTHKMKLFLILIVGISLLVAGYKFLLQPRLYKTTEITQNSQKSFVLPSDLKSKTSEEQNALNIIALARKSDAATIINTYLNKAYLNQSESDFKALVASYGSSADGETVELIEKKVGKVDFAATGESSAIAETTSEFEAASLVYRSKYFNHTNSIYLKINLYKPDPTVDAWKMYIFEFKSGDGQSPLKADIQVVPSS